MKQKINEFPFLKTKSNEDFVFSEVPKPKLEHAKFLESLLTPFSGQREKILKENPSPGFSFILSDPNKV